MSFFNDPFYDFFGDVSDAFTHVNRALSDRPSASSRQVSKPRQDSVSPWFSGRSFFDDSFTPALNVHESDNAYTLKVSAPGAVKDNLVIDFDKESNQLTVKGEIPEYNEERKDEEGNLVYREMSSGKFERSVTLPAGVDPESIKARFTDGILTLEVPKMKETEEASHTRIAIED